MKAIIKNTFYFTTYIEEIGKHAQSAERYRIFQLIMHFNTILYFLKSMLMNPSGIRTFPLLVSKTMLIDHFSDFGLPMHSDQWQNRYFIMNNLTVKHFLIAGDGENLKI